MKKSILLLAIFFIGLTSVKAQVYPSTVGLRGSVGNYGIGPELSYQHGLGDLNRAEVGLGLGTDNNFNRFGLTGAFHWVGEVQSGFSWFAGPGAQVWLYSFNTGINRHQLDGCLHATSLLRKSHYHLVRPQNNNGSSACPVFSKSAGLALY